MKLFRVTAVFVLAVWACAEAQAQWGLYGSPQPLEFQQLQPVIAGSQGSAFLPGAPAYGAAPAGQGAPVCLAAAQGQPDPQLWPPVPPVPGAMPGPQGQYGRPVAPAGPAPGSPAPIGAPNTIYEPAGCPSGGCAGGGLPNGCGCEMPWYGSLMALYMTRDRPNVVWTTMKTTDNTQRWGASEVDWQWGGEVTIGRTLCDCGCSSWAIEGTYWGLADFCRTDTPNFSCNYSTPLTFGNVSMLGTDNGTGTPCSAEQWYDDSPQHRIIRSDDFQSAEIDLVNQHVCGGACSCFSLDCLAGIRYFHFRDNLSFQAQREHDGSAYQDTWISLDDRVTNDLLGLQLGCCAEYRFAPCWKVFVAPRIALCDNMIGLNYNLYAIGANGTCYQGSSNTYASPNYPIHSTSNGFSLLTQLDLGLEWQITQHLGAQVGYRVVGITGLALSDNQIPNLADDTRDISLICKGGSLVLQGVFAGMTFRF
ncbi:MAG: BBP7 family outer membrane beta-barrel protein [Thermoguttaceae bacterium]